MVDLVERARADGIDALAEAAVGKISFVDLFEIGFDSVSRFFASASLIG
ncbi:MAG: hypothetical protein WBE71_07355 [Xanthobacteraceae bacterium]|jgi:hypothetical protein